MAFSGVELLEVVPLAGTYTMASGGNRCIAFSQSNSYGVMEYSVMNTSTSEALLYSLSGFMLEDLVRGPYDYIESDDSFVIPVCENSNASSYHIQCLKVFSDNSAEKIHLSTYNFPAYGLDAFMVVNGRFLMLAKNKAGLRLAIESPVGGVSTIPTAYVGTSAIGKHSGQAYGVIGLNVYLFDVVAETKTLVGTVPNVPLRRGIVDGDWLWWEAENSGLSFIGFNVATLTGRQVVSTPAGIPSNSAWPTFVILDGVAYRAHSNGQGMVAIDLVTGRWKADSLPTVRNYRYVVGVGSNKLWIATFAT